MTYFLFNLILAVIMQAFTKIQDIEMEAEIKAERQKEFEREQKKLIELELKEQEEFKEGDQLDEEESYNDNQSSS